MGLENEPRIFNLQAWHFNQLSHSAQGWAWKEVTTGIQIQERLQVQAFWPTKPQGLLVGINSHILYSRLLISFVHSEKAKANVGLENEAPLGFEAKTSCLLDRPFDKLSHSVYLLLSPLLLFPHGFRHLVCVQKKKRPTWGLKMRYLSDSNIRFPVYKTGALTN